MCSYQSSSLLQHAGSPTDMEVEKMLTEARSGSSSQVGGAGVDDDIVVQEYFSDEELKTHEK